MSHCYREDVVAYAKSQKGKKEGSNNWNPYAQELDAVNYFAPQKKQNVKWCSVYCDDVVYNASGKDKVYTQKILYQPSYDNLSAGVTFVVDYFKKAGAWTTNQNNVEIGDWVVFNAYDSKKGKITDYYVHIGIVIDRDEYGITTSEGNKGDKVSECQYLFTSIGKKIAGFGKPKYDKKPAPTPPTPEPPVVVEDYKVVNIKTFLAIRSTPEVKNDNSNQVGELKNGAIVSVFETRSGWARIGGEMWVSLKYLKKI